MANLKKFDIRASLKEMYVRYIGVSKTKHNQVYWNGHNNLYPSECDAVITNSSTGSQGSKVFSRFLKGSGLVNESDDVIVNVEKNYKLSNVIGLVANDISKQGGSWIFISRNAMLEPAELDILNYEWCRKAKEDDLGFDGKIIYKDWTEADDRFSRKQKEDKWFYPFSNNKAVILEQIKNDYKLKKGEITSDIEIADMLPYYRGQVLYLNTTPEYIYAKSPIDAAYNDADTEYRISLYVNGEFRSGFLGKTLVVTQGLDEDVVEQKQEEIREWLGAENAKNIYTMDVPMGVDINDFLKIIQVKAQFDEKMFAETKKDLKKNILGQFESLPEILVLVSDGAMFGASEGALIEAKRFYNQQTFDLRWQIAETMQRIGFKCEIKEISTNDATTKTNI